MKLGTLFDMLKEMKELEEITSKEAGRYGDPSQNLERLNFFRDIDLDVEEKQQKVLPWDIEASK